jgi:hypothetical protein
MRGSNRSSRQNLPLRPVISFPIDKIGPQDFVADMGKRSPHEAACPRIASEFCKGRRVFAIKPPLLGSLTSCRPVRRLLRRAWRHLSVDPEGRAHVGAHG